jgi:hypothetical protein
VAGDGKHAGRDGREDGNEYGNGAYSAMERKEVRK